jgi:hypothetical protein
MYELVKGYVVAIVRRLYVMDSFSRLIKFSETDKVTRYWDVQFIYLFSTYVYYGIIQKLGV